MNGNTFSVTNPYNAHPCHNSGIYALNGMCMQCHFSSISTRLQTSVGIYWELQFGLIVINGFDVSEICTPSNRTIRIEIDCRPQDLASVHQCPYAASAHSL